MITKTLDLGCGLNPRNSFDCNEVYGIDIRKKRFKYINVDLVIDPIPFYESFFDYVAAYDFI
jgi:hypothetical protein